MKAQLVPLYFRSCRDEDFETQLNVLRERLSDNADILQPVALGSTLPVADAAVFPQLLGQAYSQAHLVKQIGVPILVLTSEFGTMSMWDWEIASFLETRGVDLIMPYNLEQTTRICASLALKRDLRQTKFVVFQDNPGEGFQAPIFKRFYWWENECAHLLKDKFGVTLEYRSFKELGDRASRISDAQAKAAWEKWDLKTENLTTHNLNSAIKLYLALVEETNRDPRIKGMGINCLNESHFSDTTPCLAWDMLFEEKDIVWACEADTLSLMTMYLAHHGLGAPIMMTNIYPFLMGMAALKHEHIPSFPDVDHPENCLLIAHCGYLGVVPRSQASEWTLRPKVLAIVNDNATAIDARMPMGPSTMVKLGPTMQKLMAVDCTLESYVGYPGSHCVNGAVIRVADGHKVMARAYSHHQCFLSGNWKTDLKLMGKVFDIQIEEIDKPPADAFGTSRS